MMKKAWIRGNWIEEGEETEEEREFYLYLGVFTPKEGYLAVYMKEENDEFKGIEVMPVLAFIVRVHIYPFEEHLVEVLPIVFDHHHLDVDVEYKEDHLLLGVVPVSLFEELKSEYEEKGKRLVKAWKKAKEALKGGGSE
jgi:hypothetical protein